MILDINKYPILSLVEYPKDLRLLSQDKLPKLCKELRQYLLNSVSRSSGHFASGLGVIELTVALHYIYNTPFDSLIWDVGHQAYPHKILTGRRDRITTIRQKGGLHSFPWREESEYDILSVGHSSTSISAGLGIAVAAKREGKNRRTVCVIGDGALTAGMALEAINHAGAIKVDILIVLNDNEMSISKNVGALRNHLVHLFSNKIYYSLHKSSQKCFSSLTQIKKIVKRTEKYKKEIVTPSSLFEELGFNYIGPVDGHDVKCLINILKKIRNFKNPQLLHIITKKGKGYTPAEKDPIKWHAVPKFDLTSGILPKKIDELPTYSKIFGDWLCENALYNHKMIAITPAMCEGSGMVRFSKEYTQQYFDVAIAEQHAVTFASGLAISGYKPVVAIYSTFLQRAYDQVIHDIALQKLPVMFAIDRAGIVGGDGQTHQGAFDISFLRCIPNMIIMTPSDENEFRQMLHTGYHYQYGPTAVRYPKGTGTGVILLPLKILPIGKGVVRRRGKKIAILNFGTLMHNALITAELLNATLVDMRFVKPLDEDLVIRLVATHDSLVTLEENVIIGGAGSGVNELLMLKRKIVPVLNLGLPDTFIPQGTQIESLHDVQLDAEGIMNQIKNWL
ncbi:1-deoxy-D-xylulose-5-phosphate synthase [Candidatus Profftia sp. (ex Adelges kitamiensis)]|uniref:1-deoxy-D-xylulose-5-phosphate synthase n=1 Tax=Candidatus Profftia sp. (ex Adelges kitamiensis) TaxID=2864218 RepID=UPI001CE2BADC|nr:1-deoxy-D-xylulose-5-phosphate synthase [Candidatus Profftia sp. (ex Adelges kitamiensis)]